MPITYMKKLTLLFCLKPKNATRLFVVDENEKLALGASETILASLHKDVGMFPVGA